MCGAFAAFFRQCGGNGSNGSSHAKGCDEFTPFHKGEKQKDKKTATKVDARSQAAYGRLVGTEIRRHTPNTLAREPGSVEVTFKIGECGRVVSQTIRRSSHPELAARATKILAAVKAPPPPGGSYSAHQVFNFH